MFDMSEGKCASSGATCGRSSEGRVSAGGYAFERVGLDVFGQISVSSGVY